jgi:hypothetical protein
MKAPFTFKKPSEPRQVAFGHFFTHAQVKIRSDAASFQNVTAIRTYSALRPAIS